jgi:hypothetical protein
MIGTKMSNIQELRLELFEVCELINDILNDTEHAVMNQKHPMHREAEAAFNKLQLYAQNLADRIQRNGRSAPECINLGRPRIKPININ